MVTQKSPNVTLTHTPPLGLRTSRDGKKQLQHPLSPPSLSLYHWYHQPLAALDCAAFFWEVLGPGKNSKVPLDPVLLPNQFNIKDRLYYFSPISPILS